MTGMAELTAIDAVLHYIDDEIHEIEAPATDLATPVEGVDRLAVRVDPPAGGPRNERPVLEARVLRQPSVGQVLEIARDAYLTCLAALDGASTNGNCGCEETTLAFARGAEDRLRAKEAGGLIAIDRLEPTTNAYSSYMGFWEGNGPVLEDGLLTLSPIIGS